MLSTILMTKLLVPEIDSQTAVLGSVVTGGNTLGALFLGVTKRNEIDASKSEAARLVENLVGFLKNLSDVPGQETNNVVVSVLKSLGSEKLKQIEDYNNAKYPEPDAQGRIIRGWISSSRGVGLGTHS